MTQEIIEGLTRHVLTKLGGILLAHGWMTGSNEQMLIACGVSAVGAVWSVLHKMNNQTPQPPAVTP